MHLILNYRWFDMSITVLEDEPKILWEKNSEFDWAPLLQS